MAKRAVLIGVNRYRMPGADLRGCVSDVDTMSKLLTGTFGFAAGDIVRLTDFAATKKAIESAIRTLVRGGQRGDVLLIHFSGHGSNVPDDDGDEADGRDEILCPADLDWKNPLRDDWLRATFDAMRTGVSLTVVTDCCHSGTITRAVVPPDAPIVERYLPCPQDLLAVESGRRLRGTLRGGLHVAPAATRRKRDIVAADLPEVLITGCRADQTSADASIEGGFHGALTFNLAAAVGEAKGRISYRELHERTTARLKRGRYDQVPQLEGAKARIEQTFLSPIE
jgi:uncharacterized caspase-like protein